MSYTKGPWVKDRFGLLNGCNGGQVVVWGSGLAHGNRSEETEANSKLIAAAPDMVEALIGAEKILGKLNGNQEVYSKIRKVLKKAGV